MKTQSSRIVRLGMTGLALWLFCGGLAAQSQPATVILVRHAEKEAEPKDDPPLSAAGRARAAALLAAVRDAGLTVVYSTPRLRNLQTAHAVADSLHIPVIQTPIEAGRIDAYARDIVQHVRTHGGGASLVIGHSNTLAPVIRAFGGPDIEEIADQRYDDLFVLIVQDGKPARLVRAKYGQRTPAE